MNRRRSQPGYRPWRWRTTNARTSVNAQSAFLLARVSVSTGAIRRQRWCEPCCPPRPKAQDVWHSGSPWPAPSQRSSASTAEPATSHIVLTRQHRRAGRQADGQVRGGEYVDLRNRGARPSAGERGKWALTLQDSVVAEATMAWCGSAKYSTQASLRLMTAGRYDATRGLMVEWRPAPKGSGQDAGRARWNVLSIRVRVDRRVSEGSRPCGS